MFPLSLYSCLSLPLSISLSPFLPYSLSLSFTLPVSISLSFSIHLSFSLSLPLSLSPHSLSPPSLSLSLTHSVSFSLSLSPFQWTRLLWSKQFRNPYRESHDRRSQTGHGRVCWKRYVRVHHMSCFVIVLVYKFLSLSSCVLRFLYLMLKHFWWDFSYFSFCFSFN